MLEWTYTEADLTALRKSDSGVDPEGAAVGSDEALMVVVGSRVMVGDGGVGGELRWMKERCRTRS